MSSDISICLVADHKVDNLKWFLESLLNYEFDNDIFKGRIEVCIADPYYQASIFPLIDRYSDQFIFKYATVDRTKSFIPINSKSKVCEWNTCIMNMPTNDCIIKADSDIVLQDASLLSVISWKLGENPNGLYVARTHFTHGENWYLDLEDILFKYTDHYIFVEGMPLITSEVLSFAGFSRTSFAELGGFEEIFAQGYGFEDRCFIEQWERYFGQSRSPLINDVINIRPPQENTTQSLVELNRRCYDLVKEFQPNHVCLDKERELVAGARAWGNPDMLSRIYTIEDGQVVNEESLSDDAPAVEILI
jgi:hypothetical protein